jgi:hypothetical protein
MIIEMRADEWEAGSHCSFSFWLVLFGIVATRHLRRKKESLYLADWNLSGLEKL